MTDEVSKRMAHYADYIDLTVKHCETRDDLLMVASLMLTTSKKIFKSCFGEEETAVAFMIDCLDSKIPPESLKKVV